MKKESSNDYQTQLSSFLENEINTTEIKKNEVVKLKKQCDTLLKQATQLGASTNSILSIITAADYGGELFSSAKQLNKSAKKLNPLIEELISSSESYTSLFHGRTKLYSRASELFQTLNKTYNLNFKAGIKVKGRLRISYNPLSNPTAPKKAIGSAYYLFIQRMGQTIDPKKLQNFQDNPAIKRIKMKDLSKANQTKFKTAALLDLNGKPLGDKYIYRAYLLVEINSKYKKQTTQEEDFISIGSYPFSINNKLSDYSLSSFYQGFKAYKNQEESVSKLYQKLNAMVLHKKAINPLISDELVDTISTGSKEVEQLNKAGLKAFEQLMTIAN